MEQTVTLIIDGKKTEAPAGTTILDAAGRAGVHIPNLCYLKGMKGVGACRLCMVEVEGLKAPVIACNTKVKEGMVVNTKTEKVQEIRKFVIDLLLSMHPLDCMTCTKAGVCTLQQYAYEFGLKESSFTRKKFGYPVDAGNPFIRRDPDYCILCGRCVRVCREQGTNVLEFMGRGIESKVITAGDAPLQESGCTFCGSCLDACPVNALLESDRQLRGREWEYERTDTTCLSCGCGCDLSVSTKEGAVQKVNAGAKAGSVEHYICAYGRFGFDCIGAETRLTVPMKRVDGQLRETDWQDALGIVAGVLKKAGAGAGFISTAGIGNEDALSLLTFAKTVVKTKNIDTTLGLYADSESMRNSQAADIDRADLILIAGLNPSQWKRVLPALDAALRKKVARGSKLIVVNSGDIALDDVAALSLKGDESDALKGIAKALTEKGLKADRKLAALLKGAEITEQTEEAARLIIAAHDPVILSSPSLFHASSNVALLKGNVVAVGLESNARGIALMGVQTQGKTYAEMVHGRMPVLYAVGEVPLSKRPDADFLVVQNSHLTELAKQADVVLPSAFFLEASGTIIDYLGRLKKCVNAVDPPSGVKSHTDIFVALAEMMGSTLKRPARADVMKAAKVKTTRAAGAFMKTTGLDISPGYFIETVNGSVLRGSRLVWLKGPVE